jgi:Ran GTPase-activating protein (RanGAP) involved in mRNA processing and transport
MSDTVSDPDSISDSSNARSDDDDGDDPPISSAVLELCNRLRANDPRVLSHDSFFNSPSTSIEVFQALKENTSVKRIRLWLRGYTKRSAEAAAKYLESSQTLQTIELRHCGPYHEFHAVISLLLQALSRNTSVTELCIDTESLRFFSVALQEFLTCTQTLKKLQMRGSNCGNILRDESNIADLNPVIRELGRNTTVTNLVICESVLSRENVQQLKSMLRQNTVLQSLDLGSSGLGSAGLAEIAPVLYRNTSIKTLYLANNGLDDTKSANVLRELIRRNKTITSLGIAHNAFGHNAAAVQSIADGVRINTTLQQLDLGRCGLDDQGISVLANALAIRNASLLVLDLHNNVITSVGVRALFDDNLEAMKTLTKLCLTSNRVESEGATVLADALRRNAMPSLKRLGLGWCRIDDDGFVALVSALEQDTSLKILILSGNGFGERGFMALAESLPNINGLEQINISGCAGVRSTLPSLQVGFRKNTSLVEVNIAWCELGEWSLGEWWQEINFLNFLGQRNRFTPLLKASDPLGTSPRLGIWSRALAKVATEPDVLFHVLRNEPKLVASAGGSKKRKRDDY